MNTAVESLPPTPAGDASERAGAVLRHWFDQTCKGIWKAVEAAGRARAHRHLMDLADQCEAQQPELAKELRAASRQGPMT